MIQKTAGFKEFVIALVSLLVFSVPVMAQDTVSGNTKSITSAKSTWVNAPSRKEKIFLNQVTESSANNFPLVGLNPENVLEFNIRKDELASQAVLHLQYTPSPSLIPLLSQLKVYLNDELVGVISFTAEQLGKANSISMPIDSRYINDFNQIKLQFIGHYNALCENPANTTMWLDIGKSSVLELTLQTLLIKNDLSYFPEPFFDSLDKRRLVLPIVFSGPPSLEQQHAAAILASWFGTKAQWRGQSFPALFNDIPEKNAIVFVTNSQRPDFLKNYRSVHAPTIEMIEHPDNPYIKLLIISGRDDNDLITAVKGIATGSILFRGQTLTVDKIKTVAARQPYDAPNWVRTERPTAFSELQQYKEQLQTSGIGPAPITLPFSVPPDLFLKDTKGINVLLKYRYSKPAELAMSLLNIRMNNFFIESDQLLSALDTNSTFGELFNKSQLYGATKQFVIPVVNLSSYNQILFNFDYNHSLGGGSTTGHCESFTLTKNYGVIEENSTIDFSNYYHYIAMPNLHAFANGGFPFTRMADLSQTAVLVSKQPLSFEVTTLLNAVANFSADTGYPALAITLADDWDKIKNKDMDFLIIGIIPEELYHNSTVNLLLNKTKSWVNKPFRQFELPNLPITPDNSSINEHVSVSSDGVMAAMLGVQAPAYKQRSIVALLADTPEGFSLLNKVLEQKKLLSQIAGSVTILRNSGINGLQVGPVYYVGYLPWYLRIWLGVEGHPLYIAFATLLVTLISAFIIWQILLVFSRGRLKN